MNPTVKLLTICLSLVIAAPAIAAEAVSPGRASHSSAAQATPAAEPTADNDPLNAWIDKNAERFGLFTKPKVAKKKSPRANRANPVGVHSVTYNPNEELSESRSVEVSARSETPTETQVVAKVFTPPPEALKSDDAATQISAVMKDLDLSKSCSKFATADGFGEWGKVIIDELVRGKGNAMLEGTDDLRSACPSYDYLGVREKSYVWVKIFATMSHMESSCNPSASGQGPDGHAAGLLQLHQGRENRAAPGCKINDSRGASRSLRCGIAIVDTQIQRTKLLFSRDTHFGVLRPQGDLVTTKKGKKRIVLSRVIVGGLKELPFCQRK